MRWLDFQTNKLYFLTREINKTKLYFMKNRQQLFQDFQYVFGKDFIYVHLYVI